MLVWVTDDLWVSIGGDAGMPKMSLRREDWATRAARSLIEDDAPRVSDLCALHGQKLENVRHTRWLVETVAKELRREAAS